MSESLSHEAWAREQLATANFGHGARVKRATAMLARAVEAPGGRLTDVFTTPAELQGAYDFVEGNVRPEAMTSAFAEATLRAVGAATTCFVPFDGSSLTLVDRTGKKGFGSVGMRQLPTRGVKVIDAIAVAMDGTPVGLLDLQWWARGPKAEGSRYVCARQPDDVAARPQLDGHRLGARCARHDAHQRVRARVALSDVLGGGAVCMAPPQDLLVSRSARAPRRRV